MSWSLRSLQSSAAVETNDFQLVEVRRDLRAVGSTNDFVPALARAPEPEPEPEPRLVLEPDEDMSDEQEHRYDWKPEELAAQAAVLRCWQRRLQSNEDLSRDRFSQDESTELDLQPEEQPEQHVYPWRPEEIAEQAAVLKALQKRFGQGKERRSGRTLWNLARTAVVLHLNLADAALPRWITFFSPPQPRRVALDQVERCFVDGTLNRNSLVRVDGSDGDYQSFADFVELYGLQDHLAELEDSCRKAASASPSRLREMLLQGEPDGGAILTPTTGGQSRARSRSNGAIDTEPAEIQRERSVAIDLEGQFTGALDKGREGVGELQLADLDRNALEEQRKDHVILELETSLRTAREALAAKDSQIAELSARLARFERAHATATQALVFEQPRHAATPEGTSSRRLAD